MFAILLLSCAAEHTGHLVRATLDDGQVMLGDVQTEDLLLETGMGTVEVPLSDVGEVVPVEGGDLENSGGYVDVWLRNGSELRGRWAEPELAMGIEIASRSVTVDLPMDQLWRFQLQGGDQTPIGIVYRARTVFGDDFLVDPHNTIVELENDLGTFAPRLSECVSLEPLEDPDGDWRMELETGTVLIGPLSATSLEFALAMGPTQVEVELADLVSIERQDWGGYDDFGGQVMYRTEPLSGGGEEWMDTPAGAAAAASQPVVVPEQAEEDGWYDNRRQLMFKAMQ